MAKSITRLTLLLSLIIAFNSGAQVCSCWQTRDATFTQAMGRNDDGSSSAITLPFNFCFWGSNETTVYINNNGNITFGASYAPFSSFPFPYAPAGKMIAPFWADVDTKDNASYAYIGSDLVYYKLTSTHLIIQWDSVGYVGHEWCINTSGGYGNDSLSNTFQLIITDGTDPILPPGNNVEFCYKGMHWTTGADSPGPCADNGKGFGGIPATVGANEGDGIRFVQIGRFDTASSTYIGQYPTGPKYDGVYWLDNRSFDFNLCSGQIAPLTSGVTPCDTFGICQGDSVIIPLYFFTPIQGDSVWVNFSPPIPTGVTMISNNPGNTDSLKIKVVGSPANYGYHRINLYGYDNQTPSDTTFTSFIIEVDSSPKFRVSIINDTVCPGDTSVLTASGVTSYNWSNGATTSSIKVAPTSNQTYTLMIENGKCFKDTNLNIVVVSKPAPSIVPKPDTICPKDSALLIASGAGIGGTYKWSTGQTRDSIWVKPRNDSSYTLKAINRYCSDSAKVTVHVARIQRVTVTVSKDSICQHDSTLLSASGGGTYVWTNNSSTASSIYVKPLSTNTYTLVTTFDGKCPVDTTIHITVTPYPIITVNSGDVCSGQCVLLTATSNMGGSTFSWNTGAHTDSITVCPIATTTYTVDVTVNKCESQQSTTVQVSNLTHLYVCCNQSIANGGSAELKADSSKYYSWSPAVSLNCDTCATVIATPSVTTTYTVTGTDVGGCSVEKLITVIVECNDFAVPNVFTPNNDGINDDFVIQAGEMTSFNISIYDRWGKAIYTSNNPDVYWNGTDSSGVLVSDGTYYYVINASCGSGTSFDKKGFVQIVR